MNRLTAFTGTKQEPHQAVISEQSKQHFAALGFVFSVDDLPENESGSEYEIELREKIKSLGGKPAGRAKIETLEKQLEGLQHDSDEE